MEFFTVTQTVLNSRDPGWPWEFDQWIRGAGYVWEGHKSQILFPESSGPQICGLITPTVWVTFRSFLDRPTFRNKLHGIVPLPD